MTANKIAAQVAPSRKVENHGTSDKIGSYPAPKELATPTDLKSEEVRAVVEAINPLIADAFAVFVKTKNFHWHIASAHYRDYHLLLYSLGLFGRPNIPMPTASTLESYVPFEDSTRKRAPDASSMDLIA